jgi:hypothetical protein
LFCFFLSLLLLLCSTGFWRCEVCDVEAEVEQENWNPYLAGNEVNVFCSLVGCCAIPCMDVLTVWFAHCSDVLKFFWYALSPNKQLRDVECRL